MAQNRFLNKEWQGAHLKKIKECAGNRYTPELNVDLPIAEIFDGLSRTENFYGRLRGQALKYQKTDISRPDPQPYNLPPFRKRMFLLFL